MNERAGAGDLVAVHRIKANLLAGRIGRFENADLNCRSKCSIYRIMSSAYEQQMQYPLAVTYLDSAIALYHNKCNCEKSTYLFCKRGELKFRHLNDTEGGCEDLKRCAMDPGRGYEFPMALRRKDCGFNPKTVGKSFSERLIPDLYWTEDLFLKFGVAGQKAQIAELGVMYSPYGNDWVNACPSAGMEVLHHRGKWAVAPKLSYEVQLLLIGGRMDLAYYSYKGLRDVRLTPQAGICLTAMMNIYYGYSIPLGPDQLDFLSQHRISLFINLLRMEKWPG